MAAERNMIVRELGETVESPDNSLTLAAPDIPNIGGTYAAASDCRSAS